MPNPFPGMNPYLEDPAGWSDLHHRLINAIGVSLARQVAPRYRVRISRTSYLTAEEVDEHLSRPDAAIITAPLTGRSDGGAAVAVAPACLPAAEPIRLPSFEEIHQGYVEIRATESYEVITAIEVLSPTNKQTGSGRVQYLTKRRQTTQSLTNLVEIDLLRAGEPMEMEPVPSRHYRIVVSPAWERPEARLFSFDVRSPFPAVPIPLRQEDEEVCLVIGDLLPGIYDEAIYDLDIDYTVDPPPPAFPAEDLAWIDELLRAQGRRR